MYPVTQEFQKKIKANIRKVYGKVQINYTDPFLDQSIEVTASENANVSYPHQTADGLSKPYAKIASLDGSWVLDGTYALAPTAEEAEIKQLGWWGKQLSGVDGAFTAPYPTLVMTFMQRPIAKLQVVGDYKRKEWPVDFKIRLYGANDVLLRTETVTNNTKIVWSKPLDASVTQVEKMELQITKWSHPGRQAKILEFFTSIQETYEGEDILSINLLEEREVGQGSLPVGNISSNEIDIRLNNESRKFDAGNTESPLYQLLKPNRRIKAWLGVDRSDKAKEWVPLGVFWSKKWHAPDYKVSARVTGRDILSFLDEEQYIAKKFISDGFEISGRYFLNSPILVTNSADEIYSIAGAPNPPLGGVFSGATCSGLPAGFLDTPSACWAIISLIKIHKITKNEKALDRARLVADFIVDNLVINGDFYGSPMKLIANGMDYVDGIWEINKNVAHARTQYHALWALGELNSIVGGYDDVMHEIMKVCGFIYNNIKSRSGTEIAAWMKGAVYNSFNNIGGTSYDPSWTIFGVTQTSDVMVEAINLFIQTFSDNEIFDIEGTPFVPSKILEDYRAWLVDCIENHGLLMPNGCMYSFYHFNWSDPLKDGLYIPKAKNWDWFNDVWGDVWWVGDLQLWGIIGLAKLGEEKIAKKLRDAFFQKRVDSQHLLFYDRYSYNGVPLEHDKSISISFTGLFKTLDDILGISNTYTASTSTLRYFQIESSDDTIDGGYSWDVSKKDQNIETKTVGEIFYSSLPSRSNSTLYDLALDVLSDAGLKSDEYWIDEELKDYIIPYIALKPQTHREVLRKIAEACLGQVYCDRHGVIRVEGTKAIEEQNTVTASENANISYPSQVVDGINASDGKYASLDGSWVLDGSFILAPEVEGPQMGWWGKQLAGADGSFVEPYPTLTVSFHERAIEAVKVVGDSARVEYPVDYTIRIYDSNGNVLSAREVTENNQVENITPIPENPTNATKIELEIHKWSHPGRQVKILEFINTLQKLEITPEDYFRKDNPAQYKEVANYITVRTQPVDANGEELDGETIVAKDNQSITENGKLPFEFPDNPLVQTTEMAREIADRLLQLYKDPRRNLSLEWRGNPALLLGNIVTVTDNRERNEYKVVKQELQYSGALRARLDGRRMLDVARA